MAEVEGCDWSRAAGATADFERALRATLAEWRALRLKSAWLRVPLRLGALMSVAAGLGFEVHHGQGQSVVLKQWLRPELEDKVPPLATHQVGVAGFVLSPSGELLLMKEWRSAPGGQRVPSQSWKLPGGLLEVGEAFGAAACREVREETGVRCTFGSILAFWHRHGLQWGTSDLYVVCRLHPESTDIFPDPEEVSDCCWMPVDEFLRTQDHPLILHVLRNVYGLEPRGTTVSPAALAAMSPHVEIIESAIQWPGREPYPTYHGVSDKKGI